MSKKICYCFDLTETDIVADLRQHDGHSTIVDKIMQMRQAGECSCTETHPEAR